MISEDNIKLNFKKNEIIDESVYCRCIGICGLSKILNKNNFRWRTESNKFSEKCNNCIGKSNDVIKGGIIYRKCIGDCRLIKILNEDNFYKVKNKKTWSNNKCRVCTAEEKQKYTKNNEEKVCEYQRQYREDNKNELIEYSKQYRGEHKDEKNKYEREKRINDIAYKLRTNFTSKIGNILRRNGGKKNSKSYIKYVNWTIEELKQHIESQFESWMTWDNWGRYPKTWDDNDSSTWTWQIDHVKPASTFEYTSMEDSEFKECWALSNLRPYSSKQNLIDGSNRIRHK